MKLGYSPWAFHGSIYPFEHIFSESARLDYTPPKNCDAIVLWGGTDIDAKYYNEPNHPMTLYSPDCPRNQSEWYWMQEAVKHGVPIIGICRGAQFLTALAGGKLIQHVSGHNQGTHSVTVWDQAEKKVYQTASAHHQMMYPFDLPEDDYVILGWSTKERSNQYLGTGFDPAKITCEPEVIKYPKIKGLAIQGHPEWQQKDEEFMQWVFKQITALVTPPVKEYANA